VLPLAMAVASGTKEGWEWGFRTLSAAWRTNMELREQVLGFLH
jgi:hypothetical protein